jgi:hypothetical protein
MSKSIIPLDQLDWVRQAYSDGKPLNSMARHLGVCIDTLKRFMMRHDIAYFPGAKYVLSAAHLDSTYPKWSRPCLHCRSTEPRPKNQYICDTCRSSLDDGLPSSWI